MTTLRKVSFEHVSAIKHPEYYRGDAPAVLASEVPDEHWTWTEREGDVDDQYQGLLELQASGELIRNVRLFEADPVPEPQWRPAP